MTGYLERAHEASARSIIDRHGDVDRVIVYPDVTGAWRWTYRAARNGEILADSGQGYSSLDDAIRGAERVIDRTLVESPPPALVNLDRWLQVVVVPGATS